MAVVLAGLLLRPEFILADNAAFDLSIHARILERRFPCDQHELVVHPDGSGDFAREVLAGSSVKVPLPATDTGLLRVVV